jgi:NAD(P)-dependent dehydrogenase (short-subunit alcohol dehydrogenase family)
MDKAVEAIEQTASDPTANSSSQVIPFIINMLDTNSISADIQDIFEDKIMNNRLLLVNNAGVCLEGCTIEALKESLEVNCIGPAFLSEVFLNYANIDRKELGNQISIINVSSGDGELVFLHSEIQRQINALETYEVRVPIFSQQYHPLQIFV